MQKTTNLNLNKPETTDFYDVDDFNENADILDSAINTINTTLNGLSTVATSGSYNDLTDKPDAYTLPKASTTTLGGIKVGDNLSIDSNGVLSADGDATIILETEAEYEALSEAEKLAGTYLIKESNEETIGASVIPYDSSVSVKTKIDAIDTKLNNNLIESDSFNSSHTYSIGDMFNCDGKLYKVKVACSGVTPPNATYYDEYTLTSELMALNNSLSTLEVSDISVTYNSHCVQDSHIAQAYKTGKIGVISGSVYFSQAGNLSFASVDISPRNNDDHFMLYRTDGGGVRYVDFKNGSFTVTNAEANTWYAFEHTFVI